MGGACSKCQDVQVGGKGLGAAKALEASDSEEDVEDESDGEDEDEGDELEEEKGEAEQALLQKLKTGKTRIFKEAIDHATSLGLDEDKISKAEQKLEEHKALRRREAFEAELRDFLSGDEITMDACEEMLQKGKGYGVTEKVLKPLHEKAEELERLRELNTEELENAKRFLEACTRRFIASCVKGRETTWIDLADGTKLKATAWLDLTLKNLRLTGISDDEIKTCKIADIAAKRALESDEVMELAGWEKLGDDEKENAVAVVGENDGPWCFVEASRQNQDEFICALAVLNGRKIGPRSS